MLRPPRKPCRLQGLSKGGQSLLRTQIGDLLLTIILASSVLYELVGPACAKASFFLSGAIKQEVIDSVNRYQPPQFKKRLG